jgi:hypothetical protein
MDEAGRSSGVYDKKGYKMNKMAVGWTMTGEILMVRQERACWIDRRACKMDRRGCKMDRRGYTRG